MSYTQSEIKPYKKYPIARADVLCNEGVWHHSEFPHELVTLDFDADGNLLAVVVLGTDLRVETETTEPPLA